MNKFETKPEVVEKARELSSWSKSSEIEWSQFRKCQAWVSGLIDNRYFLIKSYRTIVGLVDTSTGDFYEIGKYSPATSKQMTQIYNSMFRSTERHLIGGEV